jgi:hypothetical protein
MDTNTAVPAPLAFVLSSLQLKTEKKSNYRLIAGDDSNYQPIPTPNFQHVTVIELQVERHC